jgi:hypothetical protein
MDMGCQRHICVTFVFDRHGMRIILAPADAKSPILGPNCASLRLLVGTGERRRGTMGR